MELDEKRSRVRSDIEAIGITTGRCPLSACAAGRRPLVPLGGRHRPTSDEPGISARVDDGCRVEMPGVVPAACPVDVGCAIGGEGLVTHRSTSRQGLFALFARVLVDGKAVISAEDSTPGGARSHSTTLWLPACDRIRAVTGHRASGSRIGMERRWVRVRRSARAPALPGPVVGTLRCVDDGGWAPSDPPPRLAAHDRFVADCCRGASRRIRLPICRDMLLPPSRNPSISTSCPACLSRRGRG